MKKKNYKAYSIALIIVLLAAIFFYGFLAGAYRYWPYSLLQSNYKKLISDEYNLIYEEIDPLYEKTDVSSLINIKNENDVLEKRKKLIRYIWKGKGFPFTKFPENIETGIKDSRYSDLSNLKSIDKLTVNMEHGINSIAYHFYSEKSNNNLVIYHQGHLGDFILGKRTIQFFLDEGYDVIALSMPLLGMNNKPIIDLESFGVIKLTSHNHLKFLESNRFSSIKIFLDPVAASVNYAEKNFNFDSVHMVGISGGAWTTTLYSAIDTRVSKSYPVSGTVPIYLRSIRDLGDYEQTLPELYKIASYPELYILSGFGNDRGQVQIVNKYDDCCFAGINYRTYEDEVIAVFAELEKGNFEVYLDESHAEHKISENALSAIKEDIDK
ncbi:MAG: hypothetical protein QGH34_02920 [Candidatus Woesearchaeota archaeon]|jgi:hypothetical protein|nr:hypothetical protein [Candidatus Woesearchaeota archaeon]|tara:strand:- start:2935 stop:4077 length:1143 start_codon:yes stop_codon:yes gene_type:complete